MFQFTKEQYQKGAFWTGLGGGLGLFVGGGFYASSAVSRFWRSTAEPQGDYIEDVLLDPNFAELSGLAIILVSAALIAASLNFDRLAKKAPRTQEAVSPELVTA